MNGVMAQRGLLTPVLALTLLSLACLLAWQYMAPDLGRLFDVSGDYDGRRLLLLHSTLPRMATALISGAALALAGTLLQQVLRNPLASPTTLGVSAGANLALVAVTLAFPALGGFSRDAVAIAGSAMAAAAVFVIGARRGFSPFVLILSGMIVSIWCGALAGILILMNDRYLAGLFIWGAGSLAQQSWAVPFSLMPKILILSVLCFFLVRPLSLLELGESGAGSLGVRVKHLRFAAIALAIGLAAIVTSAVGVIGFIGLVAPGLARLSGARTIRAQLIWAPVLGAGLLLLTDETVKRFAGASADILPTGAITALLGTPLLLLLLPRLKAMHRNLPGVSRSARKPFRLSVPMLATLCAGLVLLIAGGVLLGRAPDGSWAIPGIGQWADVMPYRLPRIAGAFAAGMMFGIAGAILQRLTGNEMASPEVLGISAGASIGVAVALFVFAAPGIALQIGSAGIGSLCVVVLIFLFGVRSGFAPERVLLAGIALGAMLDALVGVLAASGDPRALILMRWISGSTYLVDATSATIAMFAAATFLALTLLARRWLDLLPLGPVTAGSIGVNVTLARSGLFLLAAAMSAVATLVAGPLSFIGLMGPHLARELGLHRALAQTVGAAFIGGSLMVLADWAGRMLVFPYQIPAGLISAVIGAPVLILLLRGRR